MKHAWRWIRTLWACFLLAVVIWSVLPSPSVNCWYLSVGVPELGGWIALATMPVFFTRKPRWEFLPAFVVICLCLAPIGEAATIARGLPARLQQAFGRSIEEAPLACWGVPRTRARVETIANVTVSHFQASGEVHSTAILFVHGGSWSGGTRDEYASIFRLLAQRGWDVYSTDYRLAPANPYPAGPDDVRAVLAELQRTRPIVLMGRSAGAQLALLVGYTAPPGTVHGVIALYPPTDMVWSYDHPSNPAVLDSKKSLRDFLGGTPAQKPAEYAAASPLGQVMASSPPTLLLQGLHDQLVYPIQSERLSDRLEADGVPHLLVEFPWADHGGDVVDAGPMARLSLYSILSFMESVEAHLSDHHRRSRAGQR
jgi:acetyl esterase/lipase